MAHFAQIDENNVVTRVVVVPDSEEHRGEEFLHNIGLTGRWIQTSITNKIRKVFAQSGFAYLPEKDAFQPPSPFPSWVFDEETWTWVSPVPQPVSEESFTWNEETLAWEEVSKYPASWIDGQPPIPVPNDGKFYQWNEEEISWEEIIPTVPPSFIQDENGNWVPPVPMPRNGNIHLWDEGTLSWIDTGNPIPATPAI